MDLSRVELLQVLSKEGRASIKYAIDLRKNKKELTQEDIELICSCVEQTSFLSIPHESTWLELIRELQFGERNIR